nr:ribosome quality control complex subunit 1 [Quercus suber]
MSSRALRKAQRAREEEAQEQGQDDEKNVFEDDQPISVQKKSAFAMLDELEHSQDSDEELATNPASDEEDEDIEKERVTTAITTKGAESLSTPSKKTKKKKKKAKRAGAAAGQPVKVVGDDLDEIDLALKQLAAGGGSTQPASSTADVSDAAGELSQLLAIDVNHLHAQNEMRRLFGRAALEQQHDEEPQQANAGGNRRQQRRQQAGVAQALRGQPDPGGRSALSAVALRRNLFIQGNQDWPSGGSGGLGMEIEEKRADGTVLYKFVHTRSYQDVQLQFESCVESMDPNRLVVLLQHNPYHISTLLQVSEIAKHERDPATAGDLLERALFSFGRAVHSTFAKTLAAGKARLDFARPENREFWLASWRYMQNLSMRATWRTVYEWAKLLLSLSPEEDPYAMWLVLDQYALRSKQQLGFLNLSRNTALTRSHIGMPNIELSQGLAEVRSGNRSKGQQALFRAIGRYPWVVARIMQANNIDPPPAIWGKEPRTDRERLYSELYATNAKDLWNIPEATSLLIEVSSALPPDTACAPVDDRDISSNEARHVILSDSPTLIALIPRSYTEAMTSTSDPLPPERNIETYSKAPPGLRQQGVNNRSGEHTAQTAVGIEGVLSLLTRLFRRPDGGLADDEAGAERRRIAEERLGMNGDDILRSLQALAAETHDHVGMEDDEEHGVAYDARLREVDQILGQQDHFHDGQQEPHHDASEAGNNRD